MTTKELRELLAKAPETVWVDRDGNVDADCDAFYVAARSDFPALLDRVEALERALGEALDLATEGWDYASPYFREKWGSAEHLASLRALLRDGEGSR